MQGSLAVGPKTAQLPFMCVPFFEGLVPFTPETLADLKRGLEEGDDGARVIASDYVLEIVGTDLMIRRPDGTSIRMASVGEDLIDASNVIDAHPCVLRPDVTVCTILSEVESV